MMKTKNVFALSMLLLVAASAVASPQRRNAAPEVSDRPKIDVDSYTLDMTLHRTELMLRGVADVKFRQLERTPYIILDLDSRLRIEKLLLDGSEARYRQYDLDGTVEISTTGGPLFDAPTLPF